MPEADRLILFDGVCNLCSFWVGFILRRDAGKRFRFASLQSATGQRALGQAGLPGGELNTMVYVEGGRRYLRSTAVLRIARAMRGLWPLLYPLIVIPAPIRDLLYRVIARNRYRWFGKRDACWVPAVEVRDRFLD